MTGPDGLLYPGMIGTATAVARNAAGDPVATTLTWSSTNTAIATVSNAGIVLGVGAGTTTIRAQSSGITGSIQVTIQPPSLERIIDSVRAAFDLPALGAALITPTATVMAVAGKRRVDRETLVTLNDKWHIGSNLKAQTAALAAITVKAGRIDWTTTVATAFPELAGTIRADYINATLLDLLANRTGLPNNPPFLGATAKAQRDAIAAWGLAAEPVVSFGTYSYSNTNFIIAGAMLERAWNSTYEDLMQEKFWSPIGVTSAGWGPQVVGDGDDQPSPHTRINNAWVRQNNFDNPPGLSAAGRAHMSLSDWVKVTQELLKADDGTSALINPADGRKLTTGVVPTGDGAQYALGWFTVTSPWGGTVNRTVNHNGSNLGNYSVAWVGLDTKVGLLVVMNAYDDPRSGTAADVMVNRLLTWRSTGK